MKILIIRLSSIGDIVLTEPCVRLLRNFNPQNEIHYLTKQVYADIVTLFGDENQNYISKIHFWEDNISIYKDLNQENYDIIIKFNRKIIDC